MLDKKRVNKIQNNLSDIIKLFAEYIKPASSSSI